LGPEIITSTLVGQTIDALTSDDPTLDADAVARTLSFMVGFVVFALGILRLGYLESVLAHTVVSGMSYNYFN
jgi:MFS superfamily sulfate permease-like transporter